MRKSFTTQPALFATHDPLDHPAVTALDDIENLINWPALQLLLPEGKGETGRLEAVLSEINTCSSKKIRDWMAETDIKDRVQRKGYRNRKLSSEDRVSIAE